MNGYSFIKKGQQNPSLNPGREDPRFPLGFSTAAFLQDLQVRHEPLNLKPSEFDEEVA
jgi:hypothetical protein